MHRKIIALVACWLMALAASWGADKLLVYREGEETMVPLRYVCEWLGAEVGFNAATGQVTVTRKGHVVALKPGSKDAMVNGTAAVLRSVPATVGGLTYIPMPAFADALGVTAAWDQERCEISITDTAGLGTMSLPCRGRDAWSSPLHLDAFTGNTLLAELHAKNVESVDCPDFQGASPIYYAVFVGRLEMVRWLLARGASAKSPWPGHLETPLFAACGRIWSVDLDTNIKAPAPSTDGVKAAIIACLVEHGAPVNAASPRGGTALHTASGAGDDTAVSALLERGASVDARDRSGETALSLAVYFRHRSTVALLLARGASANTANTDLGMTPLHIAAHGMDAGADVEIIKLLIANGAQVNARDLRGHTALRIAARGGEKEAAAILRENGGVE